MEKDKKENVKHFNLKWFNKKNIDLVDDKIEVYISNLLDIDEYIEINRKFQKITLELTSILNLEQGDYYENIKKWKWKLLHIKIV